MCKIEGKFASTDAIALTNSYFFISGVYFTHISIFYKLLHGRKQLEEYTKFVALLHRRMQLKEKGHMLHELKSGIIG